MWTRRAIAERGQRHSLVHRSPGDDSIRKQLFAPAESEMALLQAEMAAALEAAAANRAALKASMEGDFAATQRHSSSQEHQLQELAAVETSVDTLAISRNKHRNLNENTVLGSRKRVPWYID